MSYSTNKQFIIRQRYLLIQDYKEHTKIAAIARKYRISRTTVYRWINRFIQEGKDGLLDKPTTPKAPQIYLLHLCYSEFSLLKNPKAF